MARELLEGVFLSCELKVIERGELEKKKLMAVREFNRNLGFGCGKVREGSSRPPARTIDREREESLLFVELDRGSFEFSCAFQTIASSFLYRYQ